MNAISLPSGENAGCDTAPFPAVNRIASPPVRGTLHKSPAYTNVICDELSVGCCKSSGGAPSAKQTPVVTSANNPIPQRNTFMFPPRQRCFHVSQFVPTSY